MKQQRNNVGVPERVARILGGSVLGVAATYFLLQGSSLWLSGAEIAAIALGLDFVYTGLTGYCPLYHKLGLSTARTKASRSAAKSVGRKSEFIPVESADYTKVSIPVIDLTCGAGGSLTLERCIGKLTGVRSVYVNPANEIAYVEFSERETSVDQIADAICEAGFECRVPGRTG